MSRFQPGEGPSRGLLRDYKPSDAIRMQLFEALPGGQGAAAALAAGQDGDGDDEAAAAGAEVGADEVVDGGDEQEEGGEGPGGEELQQQEAVHSPREVPPDRLVLEPGESFGHGAVIKTPA